ncbi:MAG: response regulator [bacterium]|nr:response regulator [bacterium]
MHKRILLVEQSDATRQVAESALRQNGYEVISVPSSEKALEVIEFTRPDLMVIGGDVMSGGDKPLYERLQNEPRSSSLPMLVIDDEASDSLPFPGEVVVSLPLDSKDFISKVSSFIGTQVSTTETEESDNPLIDGELEDDLLDAALGLDQLEVTESEIMDKTKISSGQPRQRPDDAKVGLDDSLDDSNGGSDTGRVESIRIDDDSSDIVQPPKKQAQISPDASGKLEIVADQYAIQSPQALEEDDIDSDHDYRWFINEMQSDSMNPDKGFSSGSGQASSDSSGLQLDETSSLVDPVTPPPASPSQPQDSKEGGVDHFIEEFKKEVEKIQADPEINLTAEADNSDKAPLADMVWEEKIESLTADQVGLFTRQFSQDLAAKIAERIVGKLDPDKLLALIKAEIITRAQKKQ